MLKEFKKLQGKAQRRVYGLGEDFDAKLRQLKKEVGQQLIRFLTRQKNGLISNHNCHICIGPLFIKIFTHKYLTVVKDNHASYEDVCHMLAELGDGSGGRVRLAQVTRTSEEAQVS